MFTDNLTRAELGKWIDYLNKPLPDIGSERAEQRACDLQDCRNRLVELDAEAEAAQLADDEAWAW